jgi:Altronate dehydratase
MTLLRSDAFLRSDGRKGIRNTVLVVYLVECAHHVAREMVLPFREQACTWRDLEAASPRLCLSHARSSDHTSHVGPCIWCR